MDIKWDLPFPNFDKYISHPTLTTCRLFPPLVNINPLTPELNPSDAAACRDTSLEILTLSLPN
jgi:hypothetical protein